ncbi:MAG: hypothetical protein ACJAS4_003687 [Bacteriovoracaceae bacterium]|jgi:hypothetical protein
MSYLLSILLLIILSITQVYGHGGEEHENSTPKNEMGLDADGFEIVSTAPSKETLDKINRTYISNVKNIFSNKCLSCHGVNDSPPWYYNIPGPKQLMDYDMREAKKHMDMSHDFPFGGHGSPVDDLNALSKTIKKGDMPPMKYRLMHWDSKLTETEIKVINNWIKESQKILIQK